MPTIEFRHFHLFCGLGGGAAGFNRGTARVGNLTAAFRCIGGVDSDPVAITNFGRLAGVPGTVVDLFDREQFAAFHGREPEAGWREATPDDIRLAAGGERPHIVFLSAPCKGFSGLLAERQSGTAKYQALNRLTLRGVWLTMEAWRDDPPELLIFENVPRIMTRGRELLDRIIALLRHYGYATAETTHDCGEIGGLAQSRKRFLLVARHAAKVPNFLYEPIKLPLRGVGEILEKLPLPGDVTAAGPMHRVPSLQWKTWVRLALVEAGKDWRSLNRLRVGEDGHLLDYAIEPSARWNNGVLGVHAWDRPAGVVSSRSGPTNGTFGVADPRREAGASEYGQYGVGEWREPASTVINVKSPGQGRYAVADPRHYGPAKHCNEFRIVRWDGAAGAITSAHGTGQTVADPRGADGAHRKYRVTKLDEPAGAVIAASTTGNGAFAVADPRYGDGGLGEHAGKMRVVAYDMAAGTVTGSDRVGSGALSLADPRPGYDDALKNVLRVLRPDEPSGTITGAHGPSNGAMCIADPRAQCLDPERADYQTQGHYGVLDWAESSGAIPAHAKLDSGRWSVADPRALPAPAESLVCRIIAEDGTWFLGPCAYFERRQALCQPEARGAGRPLFGKPHAQRQRETIALGLCDLCGRPLKLATKVSLSHARPQPHGADGWAVLQVEPMLHRACARKSMEHCPSLRRDLAHGTLMIRQVTRWRVQAAIMDRPYVLSLTGQDVKALGHAKVELLAWIDRDLAWLERVVA